jgi:copper chaperone CopZ
MPEEIALRFEFDKGTDLAQAADAIRERLSNVDGVSGVYADPEEPRITGLEIVAAIAVTIEVVQSVRRGVTELRKLLRELKALSSEVRGVQNVKLEVGKRKVPIGDVGEDDLKELADEGSGDATE